MFDYYGRKKVAQQQSRKVIEKYADEYAKLTRKLNFTEFGLKEFENESSWEKDARINKKEKGNMWTKLIKEMNSIKGVSIDTETSIDKLTNVNYVLYLKEYQIPISKYGINLFSNYQYEVKK